MTYTTHGLMTAADMADYRALYDLDCAGQEAVAAGDLTTEDTILEDGVDYAVHAVEVIGQTVEVRTEAGTWYYQADDMVTVTR